jgi:hypothetical protein
MTDEFFFFLRSLMLSDEETFDMTGHINTQPLRLGTQKATRDLRACARRSKFSMWFGVMRGAENTITVTWMCVRYLYFLKLIPLNNKKKAKFVSTGRRSSPLQSWVTNCLERQISKSMDWKRVVSRSPDLSSLAIFLRGSIKYRAYTEKIRDIRHLRERANTTLAAVTPEVLQRTWQETDCRH